MTANRRQLWDEYQKMGKVGAITPKSRVHAMQIINAIVFRIARSSGGKKR